MESLYAVAAIASALAAVLAWAAKLWWAREYAAAKDETIRAKDAQIERLSGEIHSLREMTPMRIREYFLSVKQQLEEYNERLQEQLKTSQAALAQREQQIATFRAEGDQRASDVARLERERDNYKEILKTLQESPPLVIRGGTVEGVSVVYPPSVEAVMSEQSRVEGLLLSARGTVRTIEAKLAQARLEEQTTDTSEPDSSGDGETETE
jgi:predicted RNase H-like nuclease (RuvC/YqgF family)